jgi:hypothetical protein
MAGEIVKGTVNLVLTNNQTNGFTNINLIDKFVQNTDAIEAIAVNPAKSFFNTQVTFDAAVTAANVANVIRDRINQWTIANGVRYDDFILTINPSGANHDITVVITRNYD